MQRLIDGDALCRVLNDHWLATSPSDRDTAEVAAERAAMCRGLDYAMRIVEQMPTIGGWISVKDRMPVRPPDVGGVLVRRQWYLVALESGTVLTLPYEFDDDRWKDTGSPVTHWMPLPEPPEEVSGDD